MIFGGEEEKAHFSGGYEQVHNHDSDDEHVSDELDTRDDMSGPDVEGRPKYIKFKQELMSKDFQFEVGMEFSSLRQFKDAILEHYVFIGRQVVFVKSD